VLIDPHKTQTTLVGRIVDKLAQHSACQPSWHNSHKGNTINLVHIKHSEQQYIFTVITTQASAITAALVRDEIKTT
jgi:hypothetical protein